MHEGSFVSSREAFAYVSCIIYRGAKSARQRPGSLAYDQTMQLILGLLRLVYAHSYIPATTQPLGIPEHMAPGHHSN